MSAEQVALAHYRRRRQLVDALADLAQALWLRIDPGDIARSWTALLVDLLVMTNATQLAAARMADQYLNEVLDAQGLNPAAEGRLVPAAMAGVASDGRPLASLLYDPAISTLATIGAGVSADEALVVGYDALDTIVRTQAADAGRVADQVALVARRRAGGYVRMVVGRTCGRCIILAGRWYRWNTGFSRHPRCDCVHIPSREDDAGDLRTDPNLAFAAMSQAEQNKAFGVAGAEAIRAGADPARVVNASRGVYEAGGRKLTTEAAGRRPRLMPEQIYREARGNRAEALRLLRLHGYIT